MAAKHVLENWMMNRFEKKFPLKGEAELTYGDGEFQVVKPGEFVRCAVTGNPIPLDELRYWSVERQEPYCDAVVSFRRSTESRN